MIQNFIFGILFLKILFWAYNFLIFVLTFQLASSEFLFHFRFFSRKLQRQQKLAEKITHLIYITVLVNKPHSFYELQLTWH